MQRCLIVYNNAWRFSIATYGILALIAYLIQSPWLALATTILMLFGAISINCNILYQFFSRVLGNKSETIEKEPGESSFVYGLTGSLLLIGFLLIYFGKFVSVAWILILILVFLMLLAGFTGVCVASLMYAVFKKVFKR